MLSRRPYIPVRPSCLIMSLKSVTGLNPETITTRPAVMVRSDYPSQFDTFSPKWQTSVPGPPSSASFRTRHWLPSLVQVFSTGKGRTEWTIPLGEGRGACI
jgi:hypothetical protein